MQSVQLTAKDLLNYMLQKQAEMQKNRRCGSLTFSSELLAQELRTPKNIIDDHLDNLQDRGRVHQASAGHWAIGRGF